MNKTILICDDEEGIRESLKLILEKDYKLLFAETGSKAIDLVKSRPIDLVILDLKMPRKDGFDTLKEIKNAKPSLKVIIATGYKSVDTAREATRIGASEYIVKPFEINDVLSVVKNVI